MSIHPLSIALVWHMHQPFYRDLRTGQIPLPWVRLHAAKDYLHMADVLARYPTMHLTINMVPSLTDQMLAWAEGREADDLVLLAEQESWSLADKRALLGLCFSISWDKIIRRYPRYAELLERRPQALADPTAFSTADYRDLVVWFNLAWTDPNWLERDATLAALVAKGRGFTLADVRAIHAIQRQIAASVLPRYRQLAAQGQLEICASPYFHAILPLLTDTNCAQRPSPGLPLPQPPFSAAEDVAAQLRLAVEAHTAHFGAPPTGLWPSEGAVSPEILPLIRAAGFQWLASDEEILGRSLGRALPRDGNNLLNDPRALYQPYRVLAGTELGPHIIFRDHELSDRIGFLYQGLPGGQAAEDLIYRLLEIRRRINDPSRPYLVSIILDGENCWEHYEHNGDVFLNALYGGLCRHADLQPVTVSEFLDGRRPAATLARLATGSWIGGNLTTWIGDAEHNRAWDMLRRAREHITTKAKPPERSEAESQERSSLGLGPHPSTSAGVVTPASAQDAHSTASNAAGPNLARAWQALYAAEGSDWFWWYSHRNHSDQNALFDRLFRHNLAAVYETLRDEAPTWLAEPISQASAEPGGRQASGYISPRLTGSPYPGEGWANAALLQPSEASTGAMQRAEGAIEQLFVGYDERTLYLRLDLRQRLDESSIAIYLSGATGVAANQRTLHRHLDPNQSPNRLTAAWLLARAPGQRAPFLYQADGREGWASLGPVTAALAERALEASVPLATLSLALGQSVQVLVTLARQETIIAQLPERTMGTVALTQF